MDTQASDYFFVYWDTSKLFPDCTEEIDCLDWTKIHLTCQPVPLQMVTTTGTSTGVELHNLI